MQGLSQIVESLALIVVEGTSHPTQILSPESCSIQHSPIVEVILNADN